MRKRSITIHGHQTSVSLEDEFWQELSEIASARELSLNALIGEIDILRTVTRNGGANLSSTLRVYVLKELKRKISPT